MDKITEGELLTARLLVKNTNEHIALAQKAQLAQQDYIGKLKAAYSLEDKDAVNLETGMIMRSPKERQGDV